MSKFKVGDVVMTLSLFGARGQGGIGQEGTVYYVTDDNSQAGVSWKGFKHGHNHNAPPEFPKDSCWYVFTDSIELLDIDLENK